MSYSICTRCDETYREPEACPACWCKLQNDLTEAETVARIVAWLRKPGSDPWMRDNIADAIERGEWKR